MKASQDNATSFRVFVYYSGRACTPLTALLMAARNGSQASPLNICCYAAATLCCPSDPE